MLVLTIFYGALSLAMVLMVVAATSLYLERKRLFSLADAAALSAAESFELEDVVMTESGPMVNLTTDDVAAAAETMIAASQTGHLHQLLVEVADSPDGRSVSVTLSAYWQPPIVSMLAPTGFRLEATAIARSVLQ